MEELLSFDIAPFQACLNMLKINTKPEVYKMLLAVLCDFNPEESDSRRRTIRYIHILLEEQGDLAACVLSFLPEEDELCTKDNTPFKEESHPEEINMHTVNDQTKLTKTDCAQVNNSLLSSSIKRLGGADSSSSNFKIRKRRKRSKMVAKAGQLLAQASSSKKTRQAPKSVAKLLSEHKRKQTNAKETQSCVVLKPIVSSKESRCNGSRYLAQILKKNKVLSGSTSEKQANPSNKSKSETLIKNVGNPTLVKTGPVPLINARQPFFATTHMFGPSSVTPSYHFPERLGMNVSRMPLNYYPYINMPGDGSTTAEDYLAAHSNEKKLSGPDIMSPFLKSAPTCTVSQKIQDKSPRKSPRRHQSLSSKIQALKQTEVKSSGVDQKLEDYTSKQTAEMVRIKHPVTTNLLKTTSNRSPLLNTASHTHQSKDSRSLSTFPYIHQMTFPDGHTQHLRIQGGGSSLLNTFPTHSPTRYIGPDELQKSSGQTATSNTRLTKKKPRP